MKKLATALLLGAFTLGFSQKVNYIIENHLKIIGVKEVNGQQILIFGKKDTAINAPSVEETIKIIRDNNLKLIKQERKNNAHVLTFAKI